MLAVGKNSALILDDGVVGLAISAVRDKSAAAVQNAAALEAIRKPDEYLAILGADSAVLPLFDFALDSARHCRKISGCSTTLLTEARNRRALQVITNADKQNAEGVPIALLLPPDETLWFEALAGSKAAMKRIHSLDYQVTAAWAVWSWSWSGARTRSGFQLAMRLRL